MKPKKIRNDGDFEITPYTADVIPLFSGNVLFRVQLNLRDVRIEEDAIYIGNFEDVEEAEIVSEEVAND